MNLTLTFILFLFAPAIHAKAQELPSCRALSTLWVKSYYAKLNPSWRKAPLNCDTEPAELTPKERRNVLAARAAYVLDRTRFSYRPQDISARPIVSSGRIQAPPRSMLDWVSRRMDRLVYNERATYAFAHRNNGVGEVHLPPTDFHMTRPGERGIGLAAQLIHEARHLGIPDYGHVACGDTDQYNCDATISEEFDHGGSHAVAALWLSWVYKFSHWPRSEKRRAAETVRWVLRTRINDGHAVRNAFSLRYLGTPLDP